MPKLFWHSGKRYTMPGVYFAILCLNKAGIILKISLPFNVQYLQVLKRGSRLQSCAGSEKYVNTHGEFTCWFKAAIDHFGRRALQLGSHLVANHQGTGFLNSR